VSAPPGLADRLELRTFTSALRFQMRTTHRDPDNLLPLVTAPIYTIIFLLIFQHADRGDLGSHAVLAPVLIAIWGMALYVSGEIVEQDRWMGTLELAVAAPASFALLLLGRIAAVTLYSLVAFAEAWLVALAFGVRVEVHHPGLFLAVLAVTAFATAGTALIMSVTFVLARSARTFQNSLTYPFYVLGGVIVPVALLPDWVQPLSWFVYLSWAADLLREAVTPEPVAAAGTRIAVIAGLGIIGYVIGQRLLVRALRRVRRTGTIGLA
jgi:ABC-2 type transport system permease protein